VALNRPFAHREIIGFVSQKGAADSHRFCFGGFRRRTPGMPPFLSMNTRPAVTSLSRACAASSDAAEDQKDLELERLPFSRPPFSSMNSTPAYLGALNAVPLAAGRLVR
jgi:hypothetical protein